MKLVPELRFSIELTISILFLYCSDVTGQSVHLSDKQPKPKIEVFDQLCHHQRNITNSSIKLNWVRSDSVELKRAVESGWLELTTNYIEKEIFERELQVDKHNLRSEFGFPENNLQPEDYETRVRSWANKHCE